MIHNGNCFVCLFVCFFFFLIKADSFYHMEIQGKFVSEF